MTLAEALAWRGGGIPAEYLVPGAMVVVVDNGRRTVAAVREVGPNWVTVSSHSAKFFARARGSYRTHGGPAYLVLPHPDLLDAIQRVAKLKALNGIQWITDWRDPTTSLTPAQIEAMHATAVAFGLLPALEQS